jgi:type III secretory pathway component EscT
MSQAYEYCSILQFYNAERETIGYYIRTTDDMTKEIIKFSTFPVFMAIQALKRI